MIDFATNIIRLACIAGNYPSKKLENILNIDVFPVLHSSNNSTILGLEYADKLSLVSTNAGGTLRDGTMPPPSWQPPCEWFG